MSNQVVISGAGLWKPPHVITNEELVASYNAWAEQYNATHAAAIEAGEAEEKPLSSVEFIEKASGIKQRYSYIKDGVLDVDRMRPRIPERPDEELSHQAEIALNAARIALDNAQRSGDEALISEVITVRSWRSPPKAMRAISTESAARSAAVLGRSNT